MNLIKTMTLTILFGACSSLLKSQPITFEILGFEDLRSEIPSGSYWNGSNGKTTYTFDNGTVSLEMKLGWDTSWGGYWKDQWAFSRQFNTTVETSDFSKHLYSAKPGKNVDVGGSVFAIGRQNAYLLNKKTSSQRIRGFYVSNTTFAYNSMLFGDAFAKKFNATDQDSFVLTMSAYENGVLKSEKWVYLANYSSPNETEHFILDTWQYVSFDDVLADSIHFDLISSDFGQYGINTPTYYAIDAIEMVFTADQDNEPTKSVTLFPNPATDHLQLKLTGCEIDKLLIHNQVGAVVAEMEFPQEKIDISKLNQGVYWVTLIDRQGKITRQTIVKNHE